MVCLSCGCDKNEEISVLDVTGLSFWKFLLIYGGPLTKKGLKEDLFWGKDGKVFLRDNIGNLLFCPACKEVHSLPLNPLT